MPTQDDAWRPLSRRAFLREGTLLLTAAASLPPEATCAADPLPTLQIGLVTDLHFADKPPAGTRHYRETAAKLAEAALRFGEHQPEFLGELGDLIDAADSVETERNWLGRINKQFAAIATDRHYVLGNHCVDTLTKDEFLGEVEQAKSYDAFDRKGVHFVILDACFRGDGVPYGRRNSQWDDANIPAAQLEWLAGDLEHADGPVIVFVHQRLDGENRHCVKNAAAVRAILEASGKVQAVFQGHSHQNDHREIGGIHYCTLAAMIEGSGAESNGYARLDIHADGALHLHGYRRQTSYDWR